MTLGRAWAREMLRSHSLSHLYSESQQISQISARKTKHKGASRECKCTENKKLPEKTGFKRRAQSKLTHGPLVQRNSAALDLEIPHQVTRHAFETASVY